MNTYIMEALKSVQDFLKSFEYSSYDRIKLIANELEMMKMEVEQHITNMPKTNEYKGLLVSAECAVNNLGIILELLEDFPCADNDERLELLDEIFELLDDINY